MRRNSDIVIEGEQIERLKSIVSFIGVGAPRFYIVFDPVPEQPFFAQLLINTTAPEHTETMFKDISKEIEGKIAGARINVRKLNLGTTTGAPIAISAVGKDPVELKAMAKKIKRYLAKQSGITSLYDDWGASVFQVDAKINEELATMAGITNRNVAETMNTFLSGRYLTTFREGEKTIPVYFRLPKQERNALSDLYNFRIDGPNGRIPLDGIAEIEASWTDGTIARTNQERMITVYAFVDEAEALPNDITRAMLPDLEKMQREVKPGYRIEIGGEWRDTLDSEKNFNKAFAISAVLIVFILIAQYGGLVKPLITMTTLPLGWGCGMLGLFIWGWPLNFMAQLGLVALSGMVVVNALIMIDFADKGLEEGLSINDALLRAGRYRVVPILLTALTTSLGLIPLLLQGGPLWSPMGAVIVLGLSIATFVTLLQVPVAYLICYKDLKLKMVIAHEH